MSDEKTWIDPRLDEEIIKEMQASVVFAGEPGLSAEEKKALVAGWRDDGLRKFAERMEREGYQKRIAALTQALREVLAARHDDLTIVDFHECQINYERKQATYARAQKLLDYEDDE